MNNKSLREVFEFFPNAKWITESLFGRTYILFKENKPLMYRDAWIKSPYIAHPDMVFIDKSDMFQIDWEHRKTWGERCVSREDIMEVNND